MFGRVANSSGISALHSLELQDWMSSSCRYFSGHSSVIWLLRLPHRAAVGEAAVSISSSSFRRLQSLSFRLLSLIVLLSLPPSTYLLFLCLVQSTPFPECRAACGSQCRKHSVTFAPLPPRRWNCFASISDFTLQNFNTLILHPSKQRSFKLIISLTSFESFWLFPESVQTLESMSLVFPHSSSTTAANKSRIVMHY